MDPVIDWNTSRVARWFFQNGFPGYDATIRDNDIDGKALINLDHESLKDLGIRALGKRLLVLKSIYFLKLQHDIPITSDSYVPQTVDVEPDAFHTSTYQRAQKRQNEETISQLADEISSLKSELSSMRSEVQRMYRLSILENKPLPVVDISNHDQSQSGDVQGRNDYSTRKDGADSSRGRLKPHRAGAQSSSLPNPPPVAPHIRVYGDNALQRENEAYKSFRISADDPCSKVLPHALKKYHIDDDWQNYSLCIQYGSSRKGTNVERQLELDEKPLVLFQQLKDAGKLPVFVLKMTRQPFASPMLLGGILPGQGELPSIQVYATNAKSKESRTSFFSVENNGSSSSLDSAVQSIAVSGSGRPGVYLSSSVKSGGSSTSVNTFPAVPNSAGYCKPKCAD